MRRLTNAQTHFSVFWVAGLFAPAVLLLGCMLYAASNTNASAADLKSFSTDLSIREIMPGADRMGTETGDPKAAPVFRGEEQVGFIFLNSEVVNATGYSGKPIHVVVGLDMNGVITGAKMVKHHEPIVLVGIPERKIDAFINKYKGLDIAGMVKAGGGQPDVDVVSGATVTVMVIDDTIVRAAIKVARSRALGGLQPDSAAPRSQVSIKNEPPRVEDWQALMGDGSIRRLHLSVADVTEAFTRAGKSDAALVPESGNPADVFIDLYAAAGDVPTIGRSLLGEREYNNLLKSIKPGQSALLIGGSGLYSFKGSGYVRGGIFDRFQLVQDDINVRFRDKHHKRIGAFEAEGAPDLKDADLFIIPKNLGFDPARPWRIQLLVQRATGPIKKAFTTFDLGYIPPEKYLVRHAVAIPAKNVDAADPKPAAEGTPLWQKIWLSKKIDIAILIAALGVLTLIFFFQDWLVKRPKLAERVRITFLLFTVLWIGFYSQAQLSVVNALTFAGSLINGFSWDFYLKEPLIFILWCSVAASLLFWGRGVYCGWLCPFGALQELLNKLARLFKIPQVQVPWALHERAWPVKYILFLGLLGVSLYSFELSERLAEIEPFKTVIILKFVRTWPYVLFAVALLVAGLFIERFFCRYLCPLGGALGIPGRLRMNNWLRRHPECGAPCQRCAIECMVQAIHPNGQINPNECLQCLHCQHLYFDAHRCPPMIQRRLKRERRLAFSPGPERKKETTEETA